MNSELFVIIPTYNEAENIQGLINEVLDLPVNAGVIVVDDNSPDGTGDLADQMAAEHATRVHVMHTVATRVPWPVRLPALPELVLDVDGTAISALSMHLDVVLPGQRVREARELVSILRRHRRPLVLMGDLNSDNFAAPIGVLKLEGGFTDACGAVGHNVRSFPAAFPRRRLDHILVRGLTPTRAAAGTSRASDHLPVLAELEIPGGAA